MSAEPSERCLQHWRDRMEFLCLASLRFYHPSSYTKIPFTVFKRTVEVPSDIHHIVHCAKIFTMFGPLFNKYTGSLIIYIVYYESILSFFSFFFV